MRASVNARRELKTASEREEKKRKKGGGKKSAQKKGGKKRRSSKAVDVPCAENWNVFSAVAWLPGCTEALISVGDLAEGRR